MSRRRLLEKTAAALDLPPEVALDAVKLSVVGGQELRAANHRGILIYESERIVFRCRGGAVTVSGRGLRLTELNEEWLRISGELVSILLPDGERAGEKARQDAVGGRDEK
ncbi:MAG: sporulation protein [Firmicutes bacterium]|nr:sporulation protein [Bacillota bacterium]